MRIGQGIDVHAFSADRDRPLVLGGVHIPDSPGLEGHTDADVVLHAVADAMLGAAGLGDLGGVFGTHDPAWAGKPSSGLVTSVLDRVRARGWTVLNVDCTIVAERPRLADRRPVIAASLARLVALEVDAVGVKVTSTDGLGLVGRGEGIACLAVVLLEKR